MRSFIALAIGLGLVIGIAQPSRADETLSPGKNVAYTYLTGLPITGSYVQIAQIGIIKGRKKRVLEVDVQLTDTLEIADAIASYVSVNGVHLLPGQNNIPVITNCNNTVENCTVTSNFWGDLDQLEIDNPGMFKNQPLTIAIFGITGGGATTGALTVRARMLKK